MNEDRFNLERFVRRQEEDYGRAEAKAYLEHPVAEAAPEEDVFRRVLDKFFDGKKDTRTIAILRQIGE